MSAVVLARIPDGAPTPEDFDVVESSCAELTDGEVEQLDAQELAAVRAKAFALEKSAYRRSKNVYGRTAPATVEETPRR